MVAQGQGVTGRLGAQVTDATPDGPANDRDGADERSGEGTIGKAGTENAHEVCDAFDPELHTTGSGDLERHPELVHSHDGQIRSGNKRYGTDERVLFRVATYDLRYLGGAQEREIGGKREPRIGTSPYHPVRKLRKRCLGVRGDDVTCEIVRSVRPKVVDLEARSHNHTAGNAGVGRKAGATQRKLRWLDRKSVV